MWTYQRRSSQSRRGIEPVIQAFKARTIKAGELSLGVSEGAALANRVLEYPDASGYISTCKVWRGCPESLEDDWSVVGVFELWSFCYLYHLLAIHNHLRCFDCVRSSLAQHAVVILNWIVKTLSYNTILFHQPNYAHPYATCHQRRKKCKRRLYRSGEKV